MDDSQGSSAPSSLDHPARLDRLYVTVPCKTASDALLASLSVGLGKDLNSNVLDAFLEILWNPSFDSKDVTFHTAQDISKHISEQRKRIAQKRSLAALRSAGKSNADSSLTKDVSGEVPQLIVDLVAQQLASEMLPFSQQVDWDTNMCNVADARCPREHDLLSMALVHRTWTGAVSRVLRTRTKLFGAKNLQSFLRSPRMGTWLREVYFVESLDNENAGEMVRLLRHLLRNTPNLRKLAIRTWWRLDVRDMYDFHHVVKELAHMKHLEALWLFPNRGHLACLPTLCSILPYLRSLKALYIRNWMGGPAEEIAVTAELQRAIETTPSSANLTTLTFVDGGLNETTALFLPWLLRDCPLTNLEVHTKDICRLQNGSQSPLFRSLQSYLSKLKTLRLHYSSLNEDKECRTEFVLKCTNLKTLSIIVGLHHALNEFPDSIENLHVHFSTIWPVNGKQLTETLNEQKESLKKLRMLKLTKDPLDVLDEFQAMDEAERLEAAWRIDDVKQVCKERSIDLTNEYKFVSFEELSRM